jgi:hypothetical protein
LPHDTFDTVRAFLDTPKPPLFLVIYHRVYNLFFKHTYTIAHPLSGMFSSLTTDLSMSDLTGWTGQARNTAPFRCSIVLIYSLEQNKNLPLGAGAASPRWLGGISPNFPQVNPFPFGSPVRLQNDR